MKHQIRKGKRGWWIVGLPCGPVGPSKTQKEAQEDLRGLLRFYKQEGANLDPRKSSKAHLGQTPAAHLGQAATKPLTQGELF